MNEQALSRARLSLEGLSLGDALGAFFEMSTMGRMISVIQQRQLPNVQWHFTDDTNMALSIYESLRRYSEINQDELVNSFVQHFDRMRGYGPGMRSFVAHVSQGRAWRDVATQLFQGGSFGNGGAMRIAPLGAYFADDIPKLITEAIKATEVTHAHPEGIAGAIAVSVATAIAWQNRDKPLSRGDFIEQILPHIPKSDVHLNCLLAQKLPSNEHIAIHEIVARIGNGSRVTAQDSVPLVLYCAGEKPNHFEDAFWLTASAGGDVDTTCAMVGGIVAMTVGMDGLPAEWIKRREVLPDWALKDE